MSNSTNQGDRKLIYLIRQISIENREEMDKLGLLSKYGYSATTLLFVALENFIMIDIKNRLKLEFKLEFKNYEIEHYLSIAINKCPKNNVEEYYLINSIDKLYNTIRKTLFYYKKLDSILQKDKRLYKDVIDMISKYTKEKTNNYSLNNKNIPRLRIYLREKLFQTDFFEKFLVANYTINEIIKLMIINDIYLRNNYDKEFVRNFVNQNDSIKDITNHDYNKIYYEIEKQFLDKYGRFYR